MIIDVGFNALFGPHATQDIETVTIHKGDLPGLTPKAENNGQQILVGLDARLLNLSSGFVATPTGDRLTAANGQPITYDQSGLYKLSLKAWRVILMSDRREIVLELIQWL